MLTFKHWSPVASSIPIPLWNSTNYLKSSPSSIFLTQVCIELVSRTQRYLSLSLSLSLSHTHTHTHSSSSQKSENPVDSWYWSTSWFSVSVSWAHNSIYFCSRTFCFCDFSKHGSAHSFSHCGTRGLSWWHLGG